MKIIIILCNQLYEDSPILDNLDMDNIIVLYEHRCRKGGKTYTSLKRLFRSKLGRNHKTSKTSLFNFII